MGRLDALLYELDRDATDFLNRPSSPACADGAALRQMMLLRGPVSLPRMTRKIASASRFPSWLEAKSSNCARGSPNFSGLSTERSIDPSGLSMPIARCRPTRSWLRI
jgi:hypothetical protein